MRFAFVFFLAAAAARAQEQDSVMIDLAADTPLSSLLDTVATRTGESILYDPNAASIKGREIGSRVLLEVPRERLFDAYRGILANYEILLTPVGLPERPVWVAMDLRSTNVLLKHRARFVPYEEVEAYADREGAYIACVVPIRHVANMHALRNSLQNVATQGTIGRVFEVPGAVLIVDLAPNVAAMAKLAREIDEKALRAAPLLRRIPLRHAPAAELAAALSALVRDRAPAQPGAAPAAAPEPRVVPYLPTNTLLVSGSPEDLARIEELVKALDVPPEGSK